MLPIKVPPLGESIVEATVSRWQKKEGDAVAAGDTLVELETDKITVEVPALKAGVLARQAKKEGDVVHVDDVLGEIDDSAVGAGVASAGAAAQGAGGAPAQSETTKSSPAARRIADERGIDIAAVAGTGRGGVVSKPDVLAAPTGGAPESAAPRPSAPPIAPPIAPPRSGNGATP